MIGRLNAGQWGPVRHSSSDGAGASPGPYIRRSNRGTTATPLASRCGFSWPLSTYAAMKSRTIIDQTLSTTPIRCGRHEVREQGFS
jgi:hypothetical protein